MRRAFLLLVGLTGLVACSGSSSSEEPESLSQSQNADASAPGDGGAPATWTAENCLDGQDMNAADVDILHCPPLPQYPQPAVLDGAQISLGAWEIGTTSNGQTYKYGGLAMGDAGSVVINFEGGSADVNEGNLTCWAKGYYRLRKILQDPPSEWLALRGAGFQFRFFQFQTDLRNGATGFRKISSFQNHLVKWVTVISAAGECQQPTLGKFRDYAKSELTRRGLQSDGGVIDAGVVAPSSDAGSP